MKGDDPDAKISAATAVVPDALCFPAGATVARLGLGRAGSGMPTRAVLRFALDHARARDAVHTPLDWDRLEADCSGLGLDMVRVESAAFDRQTYLRRPDFGRRLSPASRDRLAARSQAPADVVIVVGDGLSSTAVQTGASGLLAALLPKLRQLQLIVGPLLLAHQARVALADEAGGIATARMTLMILGERPGLSAADSLGAYLTLSPKLGLTDADRNCVPNIRNGGLEPEAAAAKLAWLVGKAFACGISGVRLKDESDAEGRLPGRFSDTSLVGRPLNADRRL